VRIALVTNVLPPEGRGGAEHHVAALAASLHDRGHEVTVLSGTRGDLDGPRVVLVPRRTDLRPADSRWRKVTWHVVDLWRPDAHRRISGVLRRGGYDVVHTNSPQGLSSAVFSAVGVSDIPHVHMAHDYNAICMRTSLTRDGEFCGGHCAACRPQRLVRGGLLRRSAPRLIAATDYVRDRHVDAGVVAAGDAVTIPYGVRPGRTRTRERLPGGAFRLAYIGTLGAHKGVDVLLHAFREAPAEWALDIAGAGDLSGMVRAAAASDPRITFHGFVAGPAKEQFLDDADVLVVPSVWQEPAGIVALEATIRGLPFVVTDRGGLQEMPGALVAPAGDVRGLLGALLELASGDRLIERSRLLLEEVPAPTLERNIARVERVLESVSRSRQPDGGSAR